MPNLDQQAQAGLGAALAKLVEPLPNDQRLLLLFAGLYGEGRSQGMTSGDILLFCERIASLHDQAVLVQLVRSVACPLCGTPRGAS